MEITDLKIKYLNKINESFNKLEKKINFLKDLNLRISKQNLSGGTNMIYNHNPSRILVNHPTIMNEMTQSNKDNIDIIKINNAVKDKIIKNIADLKHQKAELIETVKNRNAHITALKSDIEQLENIYNELLTLYRENIGQINTLNNIDAANSALNNVENIDDDLQYKQTYIPP